MSFKFIRHIISVIISVAMVLQPLGYAHAQDAPGNLAPDHVFAKEHFTPEAEAFSRSVLSDIEFFSFAVYAYKQVVTEGMDMNKVLGSLEDIPYWKTSKLRAYLVKDFLDLKGDVLVVRFRSGNIIRVIPVSSHAIRKDGAIEDGIVPRFHVAGDKYTIQYIPADNDKGTSVQETTPGGVSEIYMRIWEKALPYYEKARPADVTHVSWMMREACRIARAEGLDERILLPIVILHDVGYAACMSEEHARAFESDVKIKHMKEGARIARSILAEVGYDPALTEKIVRYVSVHDNWKIGDNSPFRECVEMAVFQDLDFTWMATREGFESARTQIFHKSPEEMYQLIANDEKHENRPFAIDATKALYETLIRERKSELEKVNSTGKMMIGYGPMVSYEALKIAPDLAGVYITTEKRATNGHEVIDIVCQARQGASKRSIETAEMINQVLQLMNMQLEGASTKPQTASQRYISQHLRELKYRLGDRKIAVEAAYDLKANSARYDEKLVFNDHFLSIIYEMWYSHRIEITPEKWKEEVGALWMLAERLFHELDHDPDEVEQVLKDGLFYRAVLSEYGFVRNAIAMDAAMPFSDSEGGRKTPFGELFHSNGYFHLIHRIAAMKDVGEIKSEIRRSLAATFRYNSSKDVLGLSDERIRAVQDMLAAHGIRDDVFGERIFNSDFSGFFGDHALFSGAEPYFDPYVEKERKMYVSGMWNNNIVKIKERLLAVSRMIGAEEGTARWIENRLGIESMKGKDSVRKKLYPVIQWASHVVYAQNYERRSGKLFGDIYYEGLNLMTLPIFPLDMNGEIDWELLKWAHEDPPTFADRERGPPRVGVPSREYFRAKKVSLYEYAMTHDIQPQEPLMTTSTVHTEGQIKGPIQLSLFEDLPAVDPGTSETPASKPLTAGTTAKNAGKAGEKDTMEQLTLFDFGLGSEDPPGAVADDEYPVMKNDARTIRGNIKDMHEMVMGIDITPTLDKVTHILIESDIPAQSQQEILTFLNRRSRNGLVSEKIYFMDAASINKYIADNGCTKEDTVVLLSDDLEKGDVAGDVNMLVVRKEGLSDFVNIEGLLGAARCVLNKDWDSFRKIYSALTGSECPDIEPEWLADPVEFAKHLIINLPPVSVINVDEQKKLNGMLREALVAA